MTGIAAALGLTDTVIDHVGIAVPDLDAAIAFHTEVLGGTLAHREQNAEQGVDEAMIAFGDSGAQIQLLAPLTPASTIATFIDKRGPGLQQLALRVADVDEAFGARLKAAVDSVYDDDVVASLIERIATRIDPAGWSNGLSMKLLQLTAPGVPDVYQGCEIGMLSLVDPDNRRPVDWTDRGERLERVLADEPAFDLDDEKLRVTARALRVRRDLPDVFVGESTTYAGLATTSDHALAFARGDGGGPRVVTVVQASTSPGVEAMP